MDIKSITGNLSVFLKKYKFVLLILLVGLVLMLLPVNTGEKKSTVTEVTPQQAPSVSMEQQLENVLTKIEGAGSVEVMLTVLKGEEIIYQTNNSTSLNSGNSSTTTDTVTVTDSQKNQNGLIQKVNPPVYRGAIIVCQGADNPTVKLSVTEAVSKILGIGTNSISVLKMK